MTFNYDTLLEQALDRIDIPLKTMMDYTSGPLYEVIKLHGSIDWRYWIPNTEVGILQSQQPHSREVVRAAPVVGKEPIVERDGTTPEEFKQRVLFSLPALAIPTASKTSFVCPAAHVDSLKKSIPAVSKIAIIGWRGGERTFLELLSQGLKNPVQVIAACGNADAAEATLGRLSSAGIKGDFQAAPGGFTDFVVNRRIEPFLSAV